jgi:hypothetical protein
MTKRAAGSTPPRWLPFAAPLAAVLVHASYVSRGFTWLDHGDVVAGRAVLPLARLHEAFFMRMGDTGFFRPLAVILHSLDHALYGTWAPGYHATSVLLHALVVAVTPLFLRAFVRLSAREECLAALVVAVHPLSWLVVGGVTYQQELLVTFFTLAAAGLHASARRSGSRRAAVLAVLATALALFSKETAVFWVPALIGSWERLARRRPDAEPARGNRSLWSAHAAVLVLALAARTHAVPELWRTTEASLSPAEWAGVRLRAVTRSLVELVSPWLPSTNDTAAVGSAGIPESAFIVLVAGGALAVLRHGAASPAARLVLVLGIALAPALRLVPVSRFGSPHYTFPATAVLGGLAVLALRTAWPARRARQLVGGSCVAWLLVAAFVTSTGGARFADDAALFEPELRRDPAYPEAHAELGRHRLAEGDPARAREHLEKALQPRRARLAYLDASMTHVNLALALAALGRTTEAERHLEMAREQAPPSRRPLIDYNQAVLAARLQRDADVVRLLWPHEGTWRTYEPSLLLARSLGRLGRVADARRALENAEHVAPPDRRAATSALRRSIH